VPCGALSANLVESEFFGHNKGAFTGADRPKVGKFAAVGEGTLLLDEIDTLALEQQATLLRVIETGEFEPVGSVDTQKSHARLIVAANVDLEDAAARGKFRADLYFRLNVMSFHLPPLRERVIDIAPLARGMAVRFNRKFNKDLFEISPEAMAALEAFPWPGNLRQLENVVQHAVLVSSGTELRFEHLPVAIREHAGPAQRLRRARGRIAAAPPRPDRAQRHSACPGQQRLLPQPRRNGAGNQPRHALQEDEEVRPDERLARPLRLRVPSYGRMPSHVYRLRLLHQRIDHPPSSRQIRTVESSLAVANIRPSDETLTE